MLRLDLVHYIWVLNLFVSGLSGFRVPKICTYFLKYFFIFIHAPAQL